MKYFTKSLPDTPVLLSTGVRYKFPKFPDGRGYLATEDTSLIADLTAMVERHVGGVAEISQEAYDAALKKNETLTPSVKVSSRLPSLRIQPPPSAEPESKPIPARLSPADVPVEPGKLRPSAPLGAIRGSWKPVPTRVQ